jgi:hypothetical protein
MEKQFKYLPYFFAAFFVFVIFCFYQSYFGHIPDFKNVISPIGNVPITITKVTHVHAILIVLWLLMLIVQPILIITKKVAYHRLLGKASYLIVTLLIISLVLVVFQEQTREKSLPVLASNLLDVPLFVVFYGLAIYYRKKPAYHSRFMILTILPLLSPALARIGENGLLAQLALWILLFVVEFFNRKIYKPYLIGLTYYLINFGIVAYIFLVNTALLEGFWTFLFS